MADSFTGEDATLGVFRDQAQKCLTIVCFDYTEAAGELQKLSGPIKVRFLPPRRA
jgi:hypothetical protein